MLATEARITLATGSHNAGDGGSHNAGDGGSHNAGDGDSDGDSHNADHIGGFDFHLHALSLTAGKIICLGNRRLNTFATLNLHLSTFSSFLALCQAGHALSRPAGKSVVHPAGLHSI